MSSEDKALLVGATYTREGNNVTATGTTSQQIAEGVARHDYLVAKYTLSNILTGRDIPSLSRMINGINESSSDSSNVAAIILVIFSVTLASTGAYFFLKRKHQ